MGMDARNRTLPDWFTRLRTGQLALPRFQRYESWGHSQVVTLLDSVIRGRPVGAALVLAIGDQEPFVSRPMGGAPPRTESINEHLLDGQQRLTALWRALNNLYEDRTYFALLSPESDDTPLVVGISRWDRNGQRYPLWADQPGAQLERGLVPASLLNPETGSDEIGHWCDEATNYDAKSRNIERQIGQLQRAVREANLPYLVLPVGTDPDVAIDVFVKMNTTAVQLDEFDILVAQFEGATGESLHDLEGSLRAAIPATERYIPVSELVLRVAALRENHPPTEASFMRLDMQRLLDDWSAIERGIAGAIAFLAEERIFDRERLPTIAVIPVLASVWSLMPQSLDAHGQARTVLRQYLWRSFFTDRYERGAATAALQDHRGLVAQLVSGDMGASAPILDESEYPIVEVETLKGAPWPKLRNTLARGILAVSLRGGGRDFADDTPASHEALTKREYHHLFPAALLREASIADWKINLALNCSLLTWNTNRDISAKEPVAYLRERVDRANLDSWQIQSRLNSHTIPFDQLNVGGYSEESDADKRAESIREDYEKFLDARAEAIHRAAVDLSNGREWNGLA